jgi:beta-1,2-mannobiose phosphorylase / 1,2-beta-oligomannan phosphorylase
MFKLDRSPDNPILKPDPNSVWEGSATFNGSVVKDENGLYHLLYRAISSDTHVSTIGHAISHDLAHFTDRHQFIVPEFFWERYGCEDPRVTKFEDKYYIFYTAISTTPPSPMGIKVGVAITKDFKTILEKHIVTPFNAKAMALFPQRIKGKMAAILTVNTDMPPARVAVVYFPEESDIWCQDFWWQWFGNLDTFDAHFQRTKNDHIEIGAAPIETKYGWLLIYSYIQDYYSSNKIFRVEAAMMDIKEPNRTLAKINSSILSPEADYEINGNFPNIVFPTGGIIENEKLYLYYGGADTNICLATCEIKDLLSQMELLHSSLRFRRFASNPILTPVIENKWESKAVFNPAAIYLDNKVHLIYRAMSDDNTSSLGYAQSMDGFNISMILDKPIYSPREFFENKLRPGNSGCEDPRITQIGDIIYMCYTAYDGINPPRVALTSIFVSDFLVQNWNWKTPVLITRPNIDDKDACLFPEKINGKYAIIHRVSPNILISLVDNLDFDGNTFLDSEIIIRPIPSSWDDEKIGISAPPILTKYGWLVLYHGIDDVDHHYRVGAILLEKENLNNVLYRSNQPIFEPQTVYERRGNTPNVVFPCGTVIIKEKLFVYYGGADKVVAVATINLDELLEGLKTGLTQKKLVI